MLNRCFTENKVLKLWKQSMINAILKPYTPISLLCHMYKFYERHAPAYCKPYSTHRGWLPEGLYNTRQHTMCILTEHVVQQKNIGGAEQHAMR